jgi:protein-disulfide isomerase
MSKNKSSSDGNSVSTGEISINIQPYIVPIAIIVGAILISLSIFFGMKGQLFNQGTSVAGTTNTTPIPSTAPEQEQNPAAKTTINGAPFIGNKETAKVAIVEFSDVECPFCVRHHKEVYSDIVKNLVDSGKAIYVYRTYIAVPTHNPAATTEANAAYCLLEKSGNNNAKFFEYLVKLYANTVANGTGIAGTKMYDLAGELGVSGSDVKACAESGKFADLIASDQTLAGEAGVQGTPGFVVGKLAADGSVDGKLIAGAYPYTEFEKVANEMMQ